MTLPFFTIGHSNRSLEEFVALLTGDEIDLVADIRTVPRSRTNPQFNKDTFPETLAPFGIAYEHMADLGGLRGKTRSLPPAVNGFWTNLLGWVSVAVTFAAAVGLVLTWGQG